MMVKITAKRPIRPGGRHNVMECRSTICEQKGDLSPKYLRRRGFGLVWAVLVVFALFLLVGLSLDYAKLFYNSHQLQNAADAAALAGAQIVKVSTADETRQRTYDLAYANTAEKLEVTLRTTAQADPFVDETNLDIILGRWINHQRRFFETLDSPDAVKVIARRATGLTDAPALALLFGPLVDVDDANAIRVAIGWYNEASGAGLIVLDEEPNDPSTNKPIPGLFIADSVGNISVVGGSIQVNTIWEGTKLNNTPPASLYVKAGGNMQCARLTITGHTDPTPGSEDWNNIWEDEYGMEVPYDIWEGAPYMPDPLRDVEPPNWPDYPQRSYNENTDGSCTLDPGYYPDGIKIGKTGTSVTLNPGTYILGGGNLPGNTMNGLILNGGTFIGHGVLLYLTKDYVHPNGKWAQLDIEGNVITDIFPPGDLPENYVNGKPSINGLPGISIWQDRENTENRAELNGETGITISGTLYFPNNHCYLAGNPGKTGNQILCGSVEVFGKAQILVEYDGRNDQSKGISVLVQ